jgi:hypothetical protein
VSFSEARDSRESPSLAVRLGFRNACHNREARNNGEPSAAAGERHIVGLDVIIKGNFGFENFDNLGDSFPPKTEPLKFLLDFVQLESGFVESGLVLVLGKIV